MGGASVSAHLLLSCVFGTHFGMCGGMQHYFNHTCPSCADICLYPENAGLASFGGELGAPTLDSRDRNLPLLDAADEAYAQFFRYLAAAQASGAAPAFLFIYYAHQLPHILVLVWSGSNTLVMQGRHICAKNESERAAYPPGVVTVGPCM